MLQFESLPVEPLRITSGYGKRNTGIHGATTWHDGVDLGRDKSKYSGSTNGGPVKAVLLGKVTSSYYNKYRGWVVIVDHGTIDGKRTHTLYQHLRTKGANVGVQVKAGDIIGTMGKSGVGAGLHLHFELGIDGKCVDPTGYLENIKEVEDMTKEETLALIKEVLAGQKEAKPSGWAKDTWEKGKAKGVTDGTAPNGYCTREQVVSMLQRSK